MIAFSEGVTVRQWRSLPFLIGEGIELRSTDSRGRLSLHKAVWQNASYGATLKTVPAANLPPTSLVP